MTYAITTEHAFVASHAIRLYDGTWEPMHEHDWKLRVTVSRPTLDEIGVVIDFHKLAADVEAILEPFRGKRFNDVPPFDAINPTAEKIAEFVAAMLRLPPGVQLDQIELLEAPGCWAIVRG
jgi:6-pyruvoyltetrahydropterin/6-carboxytetrahydropterin synthase